MSIFWYGYMPYKQSNEDKVKVKYSHQRIKQILHEDYHYELIPIDVGYKGKRRRGYIQRYNILSMDTGKIILEGATLNALRIVLQDEGYPLKETVKPCQDAVDFLAHVESLKQNNK